jgi:hypothetical protein
MKIIQRGNKWVWQKKPGVEHVCDTKEEAHELSGIPLEMPEKIPTPEVREYDSMEDAIAEED